MDARLSVATNSLVQTFTPDADHDISSVILKLGQTGGSPGTITVGIYATTGGEATGSALDEGTTDGSTLPSDPSNEERTFTFSNTPSLTSGTVYAILATPENAAPATIKFAYDSTSSTYTDGKLFTGSMGSWTEQTDKDIYFKEYGLPPVAVPASDAYVTKKLVALASDELWYESSAGTMSQLAASVGQIDTSDFITSCEAYGKRFIANGSNLKIADFVNIKITTTNQGTHPPDFGTVLTGGTSGATMVVDYITSYTADAACTIYGRQTSTADFEAETVTGTDDDDNAISFTGTAQVSGPHWYDWTVFGQDATFGTMPAKANLVCRYRGRLVLSGNEQYPHQWYMSKVGNPFNFIYSSTDPLTAVAGNNTDAGEVGDIVEALIPFGDDFLVFGCSSSIHLLDGDPAFGGSIDEKSDIVGVYGARAWCIDSLYNLYFFNMNGFYKMDGGRSLPKNISDLHLPNLISDWSPNKSTKRVVLSYDPKEEGVLFSITTLADGTNLNYFYSLKTEGFYPETYPTACSIFSSFNYDSTSSTYRGLMFGSNDGYLREFLNSAKDDDAGASDTAISSYVVYPIVSISEDPDRYSKLQTLIFELSGGASGGNFSDTDEITYELHKGKDAETILEDIKDGATAFKSGTLTGTGRKSKIRPRMRSAYLGLKIYNSIATKTWAINKVYGNIIPVGRIS